MEAITFYKYVRLSSLSHWQMMLKHFCILNDLKGTIMLSKEGINGAISGKPKDVISLKRYFKKTSEFSDMTYRVTKTAEHPFNKMKVRIKNEIVALKHPTRLKNKANYVTPKELNKLIENKEVIMFDTRNNYETRIGKFENAIDPNIESFRELPNVIPRYRKLKDKKIVMYCTGGVRCEKASALFREKGFKNVFQLRGGIINYINKSPDKYFEGACFVFDDRLMIPSGKKPGAMVKCSFCGKKATVYQNCKNKKCDELFLACNKCCERMNACCSAKCKKFISNQQS